MLQDCETDLYPAASLKLTAPKHDSRLAPVSCRCLQPAASCKQHLVQTVAISSLACCIGIRMHDTSMGALYAAWCSPMAMLYSKAVLF